jgi:hypothetical protein
MPDERVLCAPCLDRAVRAEPGHRRRGLARWGQGLMLLFAAALFVKGCWMGLSESGYADFVKSMGFPQKSPPLHYLDAALATLSALLYATAWVGGLLDRQWRTAACLAGLLALAAGQIITEFGGLAASEPVAKAFALTAVWLALPVFQFIALLLGGAPEPRGAAAGKDQTR